MRIGLPKGLLFYYYYPLWKTLFEELGMEVVVSGSTSVDIVNRGVKVAVPEICVPIKVYSGHVLDLLDKGVDYIFIPRMVNIEKGYSFCPKFLGLPDLMCFTIPNLQNKIIAPRIVANKETMDDPKNYLEMCEVLGVSKKRMKAALSKSVKVWKDFRGYCYRGYSLDEAADLALGVKKEEELPLDLSYDTTIGVLGYVYNLYDYFLSMNIIKKLRSMQVNVLTFEMVDERYIYQKVKRVHKAMFWTFTNKLWGAADYFYKRQDVDGLIHVTAFGCGPDSLMGKLVEIDSNKYGKPFMTIRIDEHTGENHMDTRVEAFVDMLKRKKNAAERVKGL